MLVKLADALKQPVSLINLAALIVGGCTLYFAITGRLDKQEMVNAAQAQTDAAQTRAIEEGQRQRRSEMERLENQIRAVEQKSDAKFEAVQRDLGELKGTTREINANLQWIVRQQGGVPRFTIPAPSQGGR